MLARLFFLENNMPLQPITRDAKRRRESKDLSQRERSELKTQRERADFFRRNPHVDRKKVR